MKLTLTSSEDDVVLAETNLWLLDGHSLWFTLRKSRGFCTSNVFSSPRTMNATRVSTLGQEEQLPVSEFTLCFGDDAIYLFFLKTPKLEGSTYHSGTSPNCPSQVTVPLSPCSFLYDWNYSTPDRCQNV